MNWLDFWEKSKNEKWGKRLSCTIVYLIFLKTQKKQYSGVEPLINFCMKPHSGLVDPRLSQLY